MGHLESCDGAEYCDSIEPEPECRDGADHDWWRQKGEFGLFAERHRCHHCGVKRTTTSEPERCVGVSYEADDHEEEDRA